MGVGLGLCSVYLSLSLCHLRHIDAMHGVQKSQSKKNNRGIELFLAKAAAIANASAHQLLRKV